MAEIHRTGSTLIQAAVYVATSASMAYTLCNHVTFVAEGGIGSVGVDDLRVAWITVLLVPSILALLICALVSLRSPRLAAKLAVILCIPAWAYYAIFFVIFSLLLFLTFRGFMSLGLSILLLSLTTFVSVNILKGAHPFRLSKRS